MCSAEAAAKNSWPNCKVAKASKGAGIAVSKPLSPLAFALMPRTQLNAMVATNPARNNPVRDRRPKNLVVSARVAAISAGADKPDVAWLIAGDLICPSPFLPCLK